MAKDYAVLCESSPSDAVETLIHLRDEGRAVALILAAPWMAEMEGVEFLARIHDLHPTAKRALLIQWADRASAELILGAMSLGAFDYCLPRPTTPPNEPFHFLVGQFLYDWARAEGTGSTHVRLVGEHSSLRMHEIRDLLSRNGVVYESHEANSSEDGSYSCRRGFRGMSCPPCSSLTPHSAGQAALHLADYAARVTILVRADSLATGMSDYLIKEIEAAGNIEVRFGTDLRGGEGQGRLETLIVRDRSTGEERRTAAAVLFVLIGAEPHTDWLPAEIERDDWGYILTGPDLLRDGRSPPSWPVKRQPMLLETSIPGVFAAGDVRARSVKRVASAVGEGAIAIQLLHNYLGKA